MELTPTLAEFTLFYMTRNVSTLVILEYAYMYSDDHGATWSTPVNIYSDFTHPTFADGPNANQPYVAPFGKVLRTSNWPCLSDVRRRKADLVNGLS